MNDKIVIILLIFLIVWTFIIYNILRIYMDNKYTNDYNECVRNLYSNYTNDGIIIYIYAFNNKLQYKKFDDIEKYIEFKTASQNYIKDVEFMQINSYSNCIQIE